MFRIWNEEVLRNVLIAVASDESSTPEISFNSRKVVESIIDGHQKLGSKADDIRMEGVQEAINKLTIVSKESTSAFFAEIAEHPEENITSLKELADDLNKQFEAMESIANDFDDHLYQYKPTFGEYLLANKDDIKSGYMEFIQDGDYDEDERFDKEKENTFELAERDFEEAFAQVTPFTHPNDEVFFGTLGGELRDRLLVENYDEQVLGWPKNLDVYENELEQKWYWGNETVEEVKEVNQFVESQHSKNNIEVEKLSTFEDHRDIIPAMTLEQVKDFQQELIKESSVSAIPDLDVVMSDMADFDSQSSNSTFYDVVSNLEDNLVRAKNFEAVFEHINYLEDQQNNESKKGRSI